MGDGLDSDKKLDIEFLRNVLKIKVAFARANFRFGFITQKDLQNIENAVDSIMLEFNGENANALFKEFDLSSPIKSINEEINSAILQIVDKTSFTDVTDSGFIGKNQNEEMVIFSAFRITAALYYFSDIKQNINKIASKMTKRENNKQLEKIMKVAADAVENLYSLPLLEKDKLDGFESKEQLYDFEQLVAKELFSMVILPIEAEQDYDYSNLLIDINIFNSLTFSYALYFAGNKTYFHFEENSNVQEISQRIDKIFHNTKKINSLIVDDDGFEAYDPKGMFFIFSLFLDNIKYLIKISDAFAKSRLIPNHAQRAETEHNIFHDRIKSSIKPNKKELENE
jgi:hypothetical protein